ncbi:MAG: hypothetical protein K2Y18_05605 [Alphaproteobacteria bacterium]|jgi:D-lactate dehydrogenase|nr:hypothetical protein [Alphaproteobacteria bacterium]
MKHIIYSTKLFEKKYIVGANQGRHELFFVFDKLSLKTAEKARGYDVVSCLVEDYFDEELMEQLCMNGVKFITLRSTGYDHSDGPASKEYNTFLLTHLYSRHKQFLNLQHVNCSKSLN